MIPKFRAWDKEENRMIDDYEVFISSDGCAYYNHYEGGLRDLGLDVEFMQSTGLKDKNGVEIFEGDIVRVTDEDESTDFCDGGTGTINGLDELFMWYIDGDVENGLFDINSSYYIEVIGNIYENHELLEGAAR